MRPLSFSIANFKSFGSKLSEIPLRPITLIFGPNSAGKSSLLQALMYFHEAMESGDLDVITPRSGKGKIDLGGFKQLLHRRSGMRHIVLGFTYPVDMLSMEKRKLWKIDKSITINLTLGPLSLGGELGTKGVSLEMDGRELLRASRDKESVFGINLFDFSHPAMSILVKELGVESSSDPEGNTFKCFLEYMDILIESGAFHLDSDGMLDFSFHAQINPDLHKTTDRHGQHPVFLFANRWRDQLNTFLESNLPQAFQGIFGGFKSHTKASLASIRHVPPLRDLPPRVFDLNQHPDPLWRRIANQPELRKRINSWLGAGFMKTRYELQVREYAPIDEITSRVPDALDSQMIQLFQQDGFGSEIESLLSELTTRYDEMDRVAYLNSHPDLRENLIDGLIGNLELWARVDVDKGLNNDFLLLNRREKRIRTAEIIEDAIADDPTAHPEVWEHYQQNSPELRDFLSTHWDPHAAAESFNQSVIPRDTETRKEIALAELPSNIKVSLQDVGVGISQVLPVLMNAYGESASLIAVEQPEIHIHPALQAELADVFIESALGENKNTFLLETHSEHLILRILKRIRETTRGKLREGGLPITPSDIAVLYVVPGDEGSVVRELRINDQGRFIDDWPNGFFEDRLDELI